MKSLKNNRDIFALFLLASFLLMQTSFVSSDLKTTIWQCVCVCVCLSGVECLIWAIFLPSGSTSLMLSNLVEMNRDDVMIHPLTSSWLISEDDLIIYRWKLPFET